MRVPALLAVAVATFLLSSTPIAEAQGPAKGSLQAGQYQVVQVGKERFEVIPGDGLEAFKKKVFAEYQEAAKKYRKARREALRKEQEFNEPRPVMPEVIPVGPRHKTEAEAREHLAKVKAKRAELTDPYSVMEISGELKVVRDADLEGLRKKLEDQYLEELRAWRQARKKAQDEGKAFSAKKPERPTFRTVKGSFEDQAAAADYLAKYKSVRKGK